MHLPRLFIWEALQNCCAYPASDAEAFTVTVFDPNVEVLAGEVTIRRAHYNDRADKLRVIATTTMTTTTTTMTRTRRD